MKEKRRKKKETRSKRQGARGKSQVSGFKSHISNLVSQISSPTSRIPHSKSKVSYLKSRHFTLIALTLFIMLSTILFFTYTPLQNLYGGAITNSNSKTYDGTTFDIDTCGTITAPGEYTVVQDLETTNSCLFVRTDNVSINGNEMKLIGSASTGYGIVTTTPQNNITIKNFKGFEGTFYGPISLMSVHNATIFNNSFMVDKIDSPSIVYLTNPDLVSVTNNSFIIQNGYGLLIQVLTTADTFPTVNISENYFELTKPQSSGIRIIDAFNVTIQQNTIIGKNDSLLLFVERSANKIILNPSIDITNNSIHIINGSPILGGTFKAIHVKNYNNASLRFNNITTQYSKGIYIENSNATNISNNIVTTNSRNIPPITFDGSTGAILKNNLFTNYAGINPITISLASQNTEIPKYYNHTIDETNMFNERSIVYRFAELSDIPEKDVGFLFISFLNDSTIKDFTLKNGTVIIYKSQNVLIENITLLYTSSPLSEFQFIVSIDKSQNITFKNVHVETTNSSVFKITSSNVSARESVFNSSFGPSTSGNSRMLFHATFSGFSASSNNFTTKNMQLYASGQGSMFNITENKFDFENGADSLFQINGNDSILSSNSILGTGEVAGIYDSSNTMITLNNIHINGTAIFTQKSRDTLISMNNITGSFGTSSYGLLFSYSNNTIISFNNISLTNTSNGNAVLRLENTFNGSVLSNQFSTNGRSSTDISSFLSTNSSINSNTFLSQGKAYSGNLDRSMLISSNVVSPIERSLLSNPRFEIQSSANITFFNNTVLDTDIALLFLYTNDSRIMQNNFVNVTQGYGIRYSSNISMHNNSILSKNSSTTVTRPIFFSDSNDNTISNNAITTIDDNVNVFTLEYFKNSTILSNNITMLGNGGRGIYLSSSKNIHFMDNILLAKKNNTILIDLYTGDNTTFLHGMYSAFEPSKVQISNSNVTFINTSLQKQNIYTSNYGNTTVAWYVDATILDETNNLVSGAEVQLYDSNFTELSSYISDEQGKIPVTLLKEFVQSNQQKIFYTPNVLLAKKNELVGSLLLDVQETNSTTVHLKIAASESKPPEIFILSPQQNEVVSTAQLRVQATDTNAIAKVQARYENSFINGTWMQMQKNGTEWIVALNMKYPVPEGDYIVRFNATDALGNSNTTQTVSITVDNMRPSIGQFMLPTPQNNFAQSTMEYTVNMTFMEANPDKCILTINNQNYTMMLGEKNCLLHHVESESGEYYYNVTVLDVAGNKATSTTRKIIIDTTPPTNITYHIPTPENYIVTTNNFFTANITFNERMLQSCTFTIDGIVRVIPTNGKVCNASVQSLDEGVHTYRFTLTDALENVASSDLRTFIIDTGTPTITLLSPLNNTLVTNRNVSLRVFVEEPNLDTLQFFVDGFEMGVVQGAGSGEYYKTVLLPSDKSYSWNVIATDKAGNIQHSGIYNFEISTDTTSPTVEVQSPRMWWYNEEIIINTTITDDRLVKNAEYRLDHGNDAPEWKPLIKNNDANKWTGTINTTNKTGGTHIFRINATDDMNNSNIQTAILLYIDHTAPNITVESPSETENITGNIVRFNITTQDASPHNITLYIDGLLNDTITRNESGKTTFTKNISFGTHNWSIIAQDYAGNTNSTRTRNFTIQNITTQQQAYTPSNTQQNSQQQSSTQQTTGQDIRPPRRITVEVGSENEEESEDEKESSKLQVSSSKTEENKTIAVLKESSAKIPIDNTSKILAISTLLTMLAVAIIIGIYSHMTMKQGRKYTTEEIIKIAIKRNLNKGNTYEEVEQALIIAGWNKEIVKRIVEEEKERNLEEHIEEYTNKEYTLAKIIDKLKKNYTREEIKRKIRERFINKLPK